MNRHRLNPRYARVRLRGIVIRAIIGILPSEREHPQPIAVDIDFRYDAAAAAASDAIDYALDYRAIEQSTIDYIASHQFGLLETLCARLIDHILDQFEAIEWLGVTITKPKALARVKGLSVTMEQNRREKSDAK